jgi:hypothetical protein
MVTFKAGDRIFVDQNHMNWWNKKYAWASKDPKRDTTIKSNKGRVSNIMCKSTSNVNIEFDNYPTVVIIPSWYVHPLDDTEQKVYTFGDAVKLDPEFVENWNYDFDKRFEFLHPKLDSNLGIVASVVSSKIDCAVLVNVDGCKLPIQVPKRHLSKLTQ